MTIRPAVDGDAAALAAVHVTSWQAAYRGLMPQDFLDAMDPQHRSARWREVLAATSWPGTGTLLAEAYGNVAGFAHLCPSRDDDAHAPVGPVGEVASIYVHPDHWGTGLGRSLLVAAVDQLAAAGCAEATLWVLAANRRARRFYAAPAGTPTAAPDARTTSASRRTRSATAAACPDRHRPVRSSRRSAVSRSAVICRLTAASGTMLADPWNVPG